MKIQTKKRKLDASNIDRYLKIGVKDKFWYEECEAVLVELFGRDRLALVCQLLAATSINSSLKSNLRLFRKALYQIDNNLPFTKYLPVMKLQLERVRKGEPISGRKINNFAKAMSGDPNAIVCDIWIARAFKLDRKTMRHSGPHKDRLRDGGVGTRDYDAMEKWITAKAKKMGIQPRQCCAMIWGGVRTEQTNKGNTTRYCEIIRTHFTDLFSHVEAA